MQDEVWGDIEFTTWWKEREGVRENKIAGIDMQQPKLTKGKNWPWGWKSEAWWRLNIPLEKAIIQSRTTLQVPGPLPGKDRTSCLNREMGGIIVSLLRYFTVSFQNSHTFSKFLHTLIWFWWVCPHFWALCGKLWLLTYFLFILNASQNVNKHVSSDALGFLTLFLKLPSHHLATYPS